MNSLYPLYKRFIVQVGRLRLGAIIKGTARKLNHSTPPLDGEAKGPLTMDERSPWRFFKPVNLHREWTDFALQRRNLGFIFRNRGGGRFFSVEFTSIILAQPQLDQIG